MALHLIAWLIHSLQGKETRKKAKGSEVAGLVLLLGGMGLALDNLALMAVLRTRRAFSLLTLLIGFAAIATFAWSRVVSVSNKRDAPADSQQGQDLPFLGHRKAPNRSLANWTFVTCYIAWIITTGLSHI